MTALYYLIYIIVTVVGSCSAACSCKNEIK